jgi:hypothetical protein
LSLRSLRTVNINESCAYVLFVGVDCGAQLVSAVGTQFFPVRSRPRRFLLAVIMVTSRCVR